jgi:hypothetical protein
MRVIFNPLLTTLTLLGFITLWFAVLFTVRQLLLVRIPLTAVLPSYLTGL